MTFKSRISKSIHCFLIITFQVKPELAAKIKAWNQADVKLYDHFNKTFWKRVEAFGIDKLNTELETFRIES